jgi:hypothetical protein
MVLCEREKGLYQSTQALRQQETVQCEWDKDVIRGGKVRYPLASVRDRRQKDNFSLEKDVLQDEKVSCREEDVRCHSTKALSH